MTNKYRQLIFLISKSPLALKRKSPPQHGELQPILATYCNIRSELATDSVP
jgi:hypothetical protein